MIAEGRSTIARLRRRLAEAGTNRPARRQLRRLTRARATLDAPRPAELARGPCPARGISGEA